MADEFPWRLDNSPAGQQRRALPRREDPRLLTGQGRYAADVVPPRALHAEFVRSPHAHARVLSVDVAKAAAAPGVAAVFSGADMVAAGVKGMKAGWTLSDREGRSMVSPFRPLLCHDRVRHVGDPVAVVLADSKAQAVAAAELVRVDYRDLPAVVDLAQDVPPEAPVWPEAPDNLCCAWEIGDEAAVERVLESSAHVFEVSLRNNRIVMTPMEPRSALAEPQGRGLKLRMCTQNPHSMRAGLARSVLGLREHEVQVVCNDVGGGFGARTSLYAEEATVAWAAHRLRRAVCWTATRSECFLSDVQGRDHLTRAWLGTDAEGRFTGLKVRTRANMGAYLSAAGTAITSYYYAQLLSGVYAIPAIHAEVRLTFSNTVAIGAYRGAGRPEATYVIERLVDAAARGLGMDRIELRRRNFIRREMFPYATPLGLTYDVGDHDATLDAALKLADLEGFPARRAAAERRGLRLGLGISTYVEIAGTYPARQTRSQGSASGKSESAHVRVHPSGTVSVFTPMQSTGQGHETVFAQLVADRLGLDVEDVEVVQGDTDRTPHGRGSAASRSLVVGGTAIARAVDRILEKGAVVAAHLLQARSVDLCFADGRFRSTVTGASIGFREVVSAAYDATDFSPAEIEPGLEALAFFEPENWTYPGGCHICEVELDPETGHCAVTRVSAVDDVGTVVNPVVVHGQIHGGLAQGLGQAMLEKTSYATDTGQLQSGTFMDYAMPRSTDVPTLRVGFAPTYTQLNPFGAKGCGEVGSVGLPPALVGAVLDALAAYGVQSIDMPLTPSCVWQAIRTARDDHGGAGILG